MVIWKDAWKLTKFEYRTTPPSYISIIALLALGLFLVTSNVKGPGEQAMMRGTEGLLFILVVIIPYTIQEKHIRAQHIGNKEHASPMIALLQTMPIARRTIAVYRMFAYHLLMIVYNSIFFTLLYAFSPDIRASISLGSYIVFTIMWLSLAICIGGFQVNIEAGYHFLTYILVMIFFFFPFTVFMNMLLFYKTYTDGFAQGMIHIAASHPFIVSIGSIILAIAGFIFHTQGLVKRMKRVDY